MKENILIRLEQFKRDIFNKIKIKNYPLIIEKIIDETYLFYDIEKGKGFYGRDPSKKHSYQNSKLVLTTTVDKNGKLIHRLTNPNKDDDTIQVVLNHYFNHEYDKYFEGYIKFQAMKNTYRKKLPLLSKYTDDEIKNFISIVEKLTYAIKNKLKYFHGENIKDKTTNEIINLNNQLDEINKMGKSKNIYVANLDLYFSENTKNLKFRIPNISNLTNMFNNSAGFFYMEKDKTWNYNFNEEIMLYDLNSTLIKLYDFNMLLKFLYDNNNNVYNKAVNNQLYPNQREFMYITNFNNMDNFFKFLDDIVGNIKLNIENLPKFTNSILKDIFKLNGDLHPFQLNAITFHNLNKNSIYIGDEMGLGKTLQAISTMLTKGKLPILVITPAFLKENFASDIEKFFGDSLSTYVIRGSKDPWKPNFMRKGTDWNNPFESLLKDDTTGYDVLIINYEQLKNYMNLLKQVEWRGVIMDEAHFIKNMKAQRTQNVLELLKNLNPKATKIMMSGTIITNSPYDLVSQLIGLDIFKYIANDTRDFINKYIEPVLIKEINGVPIYDYRKGKNLDDLNNKLKILGYIRREKEEVLNELPEILRIDTHLELPDRTNYEKALYELKKYLGETKGEEYLENLTDEKVEVLKQLHQTRYLLKESALQKIELLDDIYNQLFEEKPDRKIIVFGYHKEVIDKIVKKTNEYLTKLNKELNTKYESVVFTADIPVNKRQELVNKFTNNPDAKIFITSLDVGSTGLNLQVADTIIFTELTFEPQLFTQAEGRIARIGQKASKVNNIYLLGKDTMDDAILRYILTKLNQMQMVMKGKGINDKDWFKNG